MSGLVSLSNPVGGTNPSTSTFGVPVVTNITALANPARAYLYQSGATTSIASSATVYTAIAFDAEVSDNVGGHSTTVNNSRYTCQTGWSGWYDVSGTVYWTGSSTGVRALLIQVNGTGVIAGGEIWSSPPVTGNFAQSIRRPVFLNVGDYVELAARQNSGSAVPTQIGAPFTSVLTIKWRGAS